MSTRVSRQAGSPALIWLQHDLRIADNPALQAACAAGHTPVPLYIHDPAHAPGAASAWWLHHSLSALRDKLRALGSDLLIVQDTSAQALTRVIAASGATALFRNTRSEPAQEHAVDKLCAGVSKRGVSVHTYNADLLFDRERLCKADGSPYRVFTPFWKQLQRQLPLRAPLPEPAYLPALQAKLSHLGVDVEDLGLLPTLDWADGFQEHWQPGEAGAHKALQVFCEEGVDDYPEYRDRPDLFGTSRLSPHLHFGEISAVQVWHAVAQTDAASARQGRLVAIEAYQRQLAWREFGRHLLWAFPETATQPLDARFADFPWRKARVYGKQLRAWQRGMTGIPIVDAGMRELWASGWMHNRVRMIVASFLTKNLLVPWQAGADWFMDTLVDADLANNTLGWQWVAGCGADAAPYFRIFNPVTQGERFDPDGVYVKRWVPELAQLPLKWLHHPWDAPADVLRAAGLQLDDDYPLPIVDLKETRQRALDSYAQMKGK